MIIKIVTFALMFFIAILNILGRIKNNKEFKINNNVLFVKGTFSKEKQYDLNQIKGWFENEYSLLGIKTDSAIILETDKGEKINIWKKSANEFDKISEYLNENLQKKYKKQNRF